MRKIATKARSLDDFDRAILRIIQTDNKTPQREIDLVKDRLKRLKEMLK